MNETNENRVHIFISIVFALLICLAIFIRKGLFEETKNNKKYFYVEIITDENVLLEFGDVGGVVARNGMISLSPKDLNKIFNSDGVIKIKEILIRCQEEEE